MSGRVSNPPDFVAFAISFEDLVGVVDYRHEIRVSYVNTRLVVPAWTAGTQVNMDVSGRILRAWMPAIHAGMTKLCIFMFGRRV